MELTLLGGVLLLLVLWLFVRRRGSTQKSPEPAKPRDMGNTAFHAVSLKIDAQHACNAAKEMSGRRFLSTAAPRLPLPECDALECCCRFTHHKDRRAGRDRRSPFAAAGYSDGSGAYKSERRESRDRRKEADLDRF
ncbi:MAG: hypothetical protein OER91_13745 [Gammaproteobacteria bacterium]|nr:hypothetical protein [Gammaproteobacteria bacterium]